MTASRIPYMAIPSGELSDDIHRRVHAVRPITIVIYNKHGLRLYLETDSSIVIFARLTEAARLGETVTLFVQDGRELDPDSLAALNCYLRTARIGRGGLPWQTLQTAAVHRYAWADFCEHLGLNFR